MKISMAQGQKASRVESIGVGEHLLTSQRQTREPRTPHLASVCPCVSSKGALCKIVTSGRCEASPGLIYVSLQFTRQHPTSRRGGGSEETVKPHVYGGRWGETQFSR